MVNPNAFISLRGNRIHVAAFTREHLEKAVAQVKDEFVVSYQTPVFRLFGPDGWTTELCIDRAASRTREWERLHHASK